MTDNHSILTVKEYGFIRLNLRQLMDEQKMTRNYLARRVNTNFEVINKWYNGGLEKMDLDVLARICFVLGCTVSDIIEYVEE